MWRMTGRVSDGEIVTRDAPSRCQRADLRAFRRRRCGTGRVRALAHPIGDGTRAVRSFRPRPVRIRSHRHQSPNIRSAIEPGKGFCLRLVPCRTADGPDCRSWSRSPGDFRAAVPQSGCDGEAVCRLSTRGGCGRARLHHGFHRLRLQPVHRGPVAPPAAPRRSVVSAYSDTDAGGALSVRRRVAWSLRMSRVVPCRAPRGCGFGCG